MPSSPTPSGSDTQSGGVDEPEEQNTTEADERVSQDLDPGLDLDLDLGLDLDLDLEDEGAERVTRFVRAAQHDAVIAERDEHLADLQRLQASFENYRKRVEAEAEIVRHRQRNQILTELLPLIDDLDLLGDHEDPGVAAVAASVTATVRRLGLTRIAETGVTFDPQHHEAVSVTPAEPQRPEPDDRPDADAGDDEGPADGTRPAQGPTVVAVLRDGWQRDGVTLRPALVEVKQ